MLTTSGILTIALQLEQVQASQQYRNQIQQLHQRRRQFLNDVQELSNKNKPLDELRIQVAQNRLNGQLNINLMLGESILNQHKPAKPSHLKLRLPHGQQK